MNKTVPSNSKRASSRISFEAISIGVIFSAISVTLSQGIFYLFASQIKDYLNPQAISELNAVGGVLVLAIGINMTFKKDIKTCKNQMACMHTDEAN